jgi:hypothetical protein
MPLSSLSTAASRIGPESPFWAVTSYFNPVGWKVRRRNYRIFRRHLELPLLTVELAFGGRAELSAADADLYLCVDEGDVMWQKERLLNLGFAALPDHVTHVAWLDCDIVLERPGWWRQALVALQQNAAVQVFESVAHLGPLVAEWNGLAGVSGDDPRIVARDVAVAERTRGRRWRRGESLRLPARHRPDGGGPPAAKGVGWAARRELIVGLGLYDRAIVGGGDSAAVAAFLDDAEGFLDGVSPDRHGFLGEAYRQWAGRAAAAVGGRIGCVPGRALHLWHGELDRRAYASRYRVLAAHGFDAEVDLRLGSQGAWQWATDKPKLHRAVAEYFRARREDGRVSAYAAARRDVEASERAAGGG